MYNHFLSESKDQQLSCCALPFSFLITFLGPTWNTVYKYSMVTRKSMLYNIDEYIAADKYPWVF